MPYIKSLPEDNARQGFLDRADFEAILSRLTVRGKPDTDLQDYMAWCFFTGMRTGETKALTWADFDRETWTIRLHARDSKNRKGRAIPLENELREVIERRLAARQMDCPYIFHRRGEQMGTFRKVWKRACRAAGLVKVERHPVTGQTVEVYPIPHDCRRSAVRNMVRAGVNPDVARQISGHRTPSIFSLYNIISEDDLRQAMKRTSDYLASLPAKSNVLDGSIGTIFTRFRGLDLDCRLAVNIQINLDQRLRCWDCLGLSSIVPIHRLHMPLYSPKPT